MQWEISKQVLSAFVRWALAGLGVYFVKRGIIDAEIADAWMSELTLAAVGAVLLAIPLAWKYFNAKFNILALIEAVQTKPPANTPAKINQAVADVKAEVTASPTTTISF